jgi:hypothetical protein
MSFIVPPAASTRCAIFVNTARVWSYTLSPPSTPVGLLAVMPATKS